mmetsp:Transcript_80344/g.249631  ORF Transcript_80344/g.249631 Transcript_80344/m.249631 type:complete len:252 (-) Transcript_80344:7-762(-)
MAMVNSTPRKGLSVSAARSPPACPPQALTRQPVCKMPWSRMSSHALPSALPLGRLPRVGGLAGELLQLRLGGQVAAKLEAPAGLQRPGARVPRRGVCTLSPSSLAPVARLRLCALASGVPPGLQRPEARVPRRGVCALSPGPLAPIARLRLCALASGVPAGLQRPEARVSGRGVCTLSPGSLALTARLRICVPASGVAEPAAREPGSGPGQATKAPATGEKARPMEGNAKLASSMPCHRRLRAAAPRTSRA